MWWAKVRENTDHEVNVDLKPFSLVQVNHDNNNDDGFKYWEQDDSDNALLELRAGVAAKRQGPEIFDRFFINLLRARHEDRIDLTDADAINAVAEASGVDMGRFAEDLADPDVMREIGESHTEAVEMHGAFGVPLYVFPNNNAAFVKMFIPSDEEAGSIYNNLVEIVADHKHVGEVKRPSPPWPYEGVRR